MITDYFPLGQKLTGLKKKTVTLTLKDKGYSIVEISGLDIGWGQVNMSYFNFQKYKTFYDELLLKAWGSIEALRLGMRISKCY